MSYPLFEVLALTVGSISIVAALVATLWSGLLVEEAVAQVLLLVVLVGAVHRGRSGGLATAIVVSLTYVCMRVPLIMGDGLSSDVVGLLLARTLTYGVMGIGGGALCGRIHHLLARLESSSNIDGQTQWFDERFITRTLRSMRAVATHLRHHVRLIDDVARLDDGRFLLLLPQTNGSGARRGGPPRRRREAPAGSDGRVGARGHPGSGGGPARHQGSVGRPGSSGRQRGAF